MRNGLIAALSLVVLLALAWAWQRWRRAGPAEVEPARAGREALPPPVHEASAFDARPAEDGGSCDLSGDVVLEGEVARRAEVALLLLDGGAQQTYSDARGRFALTAVPFGISRVRARLGQDEDLQTLQLGPAQCATPLHLDLSPTAELSGRVLADDGSPIPSASVLLLDDFSVRVRAPPNLSKRRRSLFALSADDGSYRIRAGAGGAYRVVADASGFVSGRELLLVTLSPRSASSLDIRLSRGATVAGTVSDGQGNPVRGALIAEERPTGQRPAFLASTSDAGTFALTVLSGEHVFMATHPDFAVGTRRVVAPDLDVRWRLEAGVSLCGDVRDEASAPANDVAVELLIDEERPARSAPPKPPQVTDGDGRFCFRGLSAGRYRVRPDFNRPGLWPGLLDNDAEQESQTVEVASTDLTVHLRFWRGLSISGVVTDAQGHGLPRCSLTFRSVHRPVTAVGLLRLNLPTYSDADGGFRMEGLKAGTYVVSAMDPNNGYELRPPVNVEAGRTGLSLVLKRLPTVRGCVKDPDGTPIMESTVTVTQSDDGRNTSRPSTVQARDGCFREPLQGSPLPASVTVKVEVDGVLAEKGPFRCDGASDLDVGDIVVGRGRPVVLTVRDGRDSAPVEEAQVTLPGQRTAMTDSHGMAQLTVESDVSTQVEVWHAGYAPSRLTIVPRQRVANVVLGPGGTVRGRVSIAGGGRLLAAMVTVEDGAIDLSAAVSEDGSYAITGVSEGRHTVSVSGNEAPMFDWMKERFPEQAAAHLRALPAPQRRAVGVSGSGITTCDFQLPPESPLAYTPPPEGAAGESGQEWMIPEPDQE